MGEELDRMRRRYHLTFKHLHKNGPSLGFDCIKLKGKKAENRQKKERCQNVAAKADILCVSFQSKNTRSSLGDKNQPRKMKN